MYYNRLEMLSFEATLDQPERVSHVFATGSPHLLLHSGY